MKIYTKTGDDGKSSLNGIERLPKDDIAFELLGKLDSLNSFLGLVRCRAGGEAEFIQKQQLIIMSVSSEISGYKQNINTISMVSELENEIDALSALYVQLNKLVVPGRTEKSAFIDIARTEARAAERVMVKYSRENDIPSDWLKWINRLSDYLYSLARYTDFCMAVDNALSESGLGLELEQGLVNKLTLTLDIAVRLVGILEKEAEKAGLYAAFAVCGANGETICLHVMDGAYLISGGAAVKKAYTSAAMKMPTHELKELSKPDAMFYGIEELSDKITAISGGEVLMSNGRVIGGLGVSGGTDSEDIRLAALGKEAFISFGI